MGIEPIRVKYNDPVDSNYLGVGISQDNLMTKAVFSWSLLMFTQNGWIATDSGSVDVDGQDYIDWNGNNKFPFQFVAEKIDVTLFN